MIQARYTLDELIHDLSALVAAEPDQARLFDRGTRYIERFIRDPEALPEQYRVPAPHARRPGGGSYVLHRGPGLLVTSVIWGPGAHAAPHDHHTWGMIGVMGNAIQETRFRRVDDRDRESYARLLQDRTVSVKPGEVSLLIPEVDDIHQMDNVTDRPTVEIHVYGADLVGLERCQYDLETGAVKRFVTKRFDNC
jgi:predicted metal-dependent enzyme (double-stranded beta helix superfamily)